MYRTRKNRRYRIQREDKIRKLDQQQNQEQRCRERAALSNHEELFPMILIRNAQEASCNSHDRVLFGVESFVSAQRHLDPGDNKETAKDVHDPTKMFD